MKQFFKKAVSGLLAVSFLTATIPGITIGAVAADSDDYPTLIYLDRDFEDQTVDQPPWEFAQSDDKHRGDFVIAEIPRGEKTDNKAMLVKNVGKDEHTATHYTAYSPISHKIVFGFDFYLTNPAVKNSMTMFVDTPYRGRNMHLQDGRDIMFVGLGKNLQVGGAAITGVELEAKRWYSLMLEIDASANKANVYLDGELKAAKVSLGSFKWIGGFSIKSPLENGDFYLDNFVIYKSDRIMSEDEYAKALNLWKSSPLYSGGEYGQGRHRYFDKVVWHTIYGHRIGKFGTRNVWNKDEYIKLSAPIINADKGIKVPLRSFGDMYGATTQWNEENKKATLSFNGQFIEFFEGKDTYFKDGIMKTMPFPAEIEKGTFYVHIEALKDLIGFTYSIDDQLIFFDGKAVIDPDLKPYEPLREAGEERWQKGSTLEGVIMWLINVLLTYDIPTAEQILEDYRAANPEDAHPRILTRDFKQIKEGAENDPEYAKIVESLIKRGDTLVAAGVVKFKVVDLAGNTNIAAMCEPMADVAFAYAMTGDEKYKKFIMDQLAEIQTGGADFRKGQFLGTAGTSYSLGRAYDWMYNSLTEDEKKQFLDVIYNLLIYMKQSFTYPLYNAYTANSENEGNQNLIINTGLVTLCLSVMEEYPELCSELISNAMRAQRHFFPSYGPEGACPEGLSYWLYTVGYMMPYFQVLECGLETDYEISDSPGLTNMHNYAMSTKGSTAGFNVGDASPQSPMHYTFLWAGKKLGNMGLVNYYKANPTRNELDAFGWVFDSGDETLTADSFAHDAYFEATGSVTMRTGWSKTDTSIYFHGGGNSDGHGHVDIGTFLFDMNGERWGDEVPKGDYNIGLKPENVGYTGPFFRTTGEGHNVVIANLGAENPQGMDPHANSYFEAVEFGDLESYAILDLTEGNPLYEYGLRAIKLDKIRNEIVIQDDYKSKTPTHFWWFMNFKNAEIEISEDGQSAILTKNGKKIEALLHTEGGEKFQVIEAKHLEMYDNPRAPYNEPNDGYLRLAITNPKTDRFHVTVTFRPVIETEDKATLASEYLYMSSWKLNNSKRAELAGVNIDGKPLDGFVPGVYAYDIEMMTEKDPIPEIAVTAPEGYDIEVAEATAVPGVTTVTMKRDGKLEGMYTFGISALNDTRRFLNDKQIPIKSFSVSSEPESQNPGSNLFDGTRDTKYATNEVGGTITIDFGTVQKVDEVKMAFTNGASRKEIFIIEYSTDGINYQVAYDGSANGETTEHQSFDVGLIDARYIRVKFYGTSTGGSWVSVSELCAFTE